MWRLVLFLIVISLPAWAGAAKWWDIDCNEMPLTVPEDFACKGGENVPADTVKLAYGKRDNPKEFSMIYVATATGLDWMLPLNSDERIQDFKSIHPWIRKHGYEWKVIENGASALGPGWACLYRHILRERKGEGYRHAIYLVHCKPDWKHLNPGEIGFLLPR